MMKRLIIVSVIVSLLITLCSCAEATASDLKFYVLNRELLSDSMNSSEIIKTAKKEGRLAFDGEDIISYNWQNHTVNLTKDAVGSVSATTLQSGGSSIFKVDDSFAFVLIIGNKLIYTGGFTSGIKNPQIPLQPSIKDESRYSFSINFDSKYSEKKDNRQNKNLYNFLENQGLLTTKKN